MQGEGLEVIMTLSRPEKPANSKRGAAIMKKITVYTMQFCPYCDSAKRLLSAKGFPFDEVKVAEDDDATWLRLEKQTGFKTMPQIFIGDKFIGGYTDLANLDKKGELAK